MKLLIIKLSALGDIVHAIPSIEALHARISGLELHWLAYDKFSSILEGTHLAQVHKLAGKRMQDLASSAADLKLEDFDYILDMQGLMKTALLSKMIATKKTKVIGMRHPRESLAALLYDERIDTGKSLDNSKHVIEQLVELTHYFGQAQEIDYGPLTIKNPEKFLSTELKQICLIPATTWESKLWSSESWAELITALVAEQKCQINILTTPRDRAKIVDPILLRLTQEQRRSIKIVIDLKLQELPEFFAGMNLTIGVDTGPLHIAAAAVHGSKSHRIIGLYGPTSARRTGPYGFESVSTEEIFGTKPLNKRKKSEDASMDLLTADLVLEQG